MNAYTLWYYISPSFCTLQGLGVPKESVEWQGIAKRGLRISVNGQKLLERCTLHQVVKSSQRKPVPVPPATVLCDVIWLLAMCNVKLFLRHFINSKVVKSRTCTSHRQCTRWRRVDRGPPLHPEERCRGCTTFLIWKEHRGGCARNFSRVHSNSQQGG